MKEPDRLSLCLKTKFVPRISQHVLQGQQNTLYPKCGRFCEYNFLKFLIGSQPIIEGIFLLKSVSFGGKGYFAADSASAINSYFAVSIIYVYVLVVKERLLSIHCYLLCSGRIIFRVHSLTLTEFFFFSFFGT